ncbi:MAG: RNA-binding cell elongation regulator Jag/EloR [Eubacteriales bacterium]|nr:RNA-binding cell elongation regulator Jag/EloR [Eubacteriales bacterium]
MLSCEGIGKNIEQAINNALLELKASREDVDIKILDEGGFFKKAKVLVSISEDALEKYEKKEEIKKQEQEEVKEPKKVEELIPAHEDKEEPVDHIVSNKTDVAKIPDIDKAKEFVTGLLKTADIQADVTSEENKEEVFLNLIGASDIIGFRGEGLNAIQYLANVYVGKNNRHAKKVRVDCDNYRAKREDTLIALANRMARKVAKTNHPVRLEPMTANERRIIHTALAEDRYVETFSSGEEPYRYLTIAPKK